MIASIRLNIFILFFEAEVLMLVSNHNITKSTIMKSSLADAREQLERREFDADTARGVTLPFESLLSSELSSGRGVLIAVFVMASCLENGEETTGC